LQLHPAQQPACCTVPCRAQKGGLLLTTVLLVSLGGLPGAYYVEKRYTEAADAYSKSLAIFDMIDDVSAVQCTPDAGCNLVPRHTLHLNSRAHMTHWMGTASVLTFGGSSSTCMLHGLDAFSAYEYGCVLTLCCGVFCQVEKQCKCLINLANLYEIQVRHTAGAAAA
jgi:hypothetical protein